MIIKIKKEKTRATSNTHTAAHAREHYTVKTYEFCPQSKQFTNTSAWLFLCTHDALLMRDIVIVTKKSLEILDSLKRVSC